MRTNVPYVPYARPIDFDLSRIRSELIMFKEKYGIDTLVLVLNISGVHQYYRMLINGYGLHFFDIFGLKAGVETYFRGAVIVVDLKTLKEIGHMGIGDMIAIENKYWTDDFGKLSSDQQLFIEESIKTHLRQAILKGLYQMGFLSEDTYYKKKNEKSE